jgi:hypothetical protein
MRFIILISILILAVSPKLSNAQVIKWEAGRPLVWGDYKGKPDYSQSAGAVTVWATNYTYNWNVINGTYVVTFNIENDFDMLGSWVLSDARTAALLRHEQLHFDINELYTRKMAAAFKSAVYTSNIKAEIEVIHQKYKAESDAMEAKYDAQTEHSKNAKMQSQWELYVYSQLNAIPRNY